jgi:RNA polymerase sigma factor (sigma-70 family)
MLSVARNLAIDLSRSAGSRLLDFVANPGQRGRFDLLDPERHLIGQSEVEVLAVAIESLPTRRREVFVMRRIENRSLREIAECLRISVKGVEQHLTGALRALVQDSGTEFGTSRDSANRR